MIDMKDLISATTNHHNSHHHHHHHHHSHHQHNYNCLYRFGEAAPSGVRSGHRRHPSHGPAVHGRVRHLQVSAVRWEGGRDREGGREIFIIIIPHVNPTSIYPSTHLSIHLHIYSTHTSIYPSNTFIYRPIHLSIHPSIYSSIYLFIYLSIHLSIYTFIYRPIHLSIHPSIY